MGWQTDEFGTQHEGIAGAVLADGSEPDPVYLDMGSSGHMPSTSEWWAYNGILRRPRASHLRGACSCGWRGRQVYAIDWGQAADDLYSVDTSGAREDWERHISDVETLSVPLPAGMDDLLERLEQQLQALAEDSPMAALKAVASLERITKRIGRQAACTAQADAEADELSWETVARTFGLGEREARSRLIHYQLRK